MTAGIINKVTTSITGNTKRLAFSGMDELSELANYSTLLGRRYDGTLEDMVDDLANLAGWTATVTDADFDIEALWNGTNVLNAVITAAEQNALGVRYGTSPKNFVFGALGASNGLRAYGPKSSVSVDDNILPISKLTLIDDANDIVNWILPLGGGLGEVRAYLRA